MRTRTRRDFLKTASAATLAALAAPSPRLWADGQPGLRPDSPADGPLPTADTVIVLWMAGGMAHTDTFDPKLYTPYSTGVESKAVLSTFPSIPTKLDGVKLSQGLERIAQVMDRA